MSPADTAAHTVAEALAHRRACQARVHRAQNAAERHHALAALAEAKLRHIEAIADLWDATAAHGDVEAFNKARLTAARRSDALQYAVGQIAGAA